MLPFNEFNVFANALIDAHDLAESGRAAQGFECLLLGLRHADEAHAKGLDWSEELLRRYREACDLFASQYGLGRA